MNNVPSGPQPRPFVPIIVVGFLAALGGLAAWSLWKSSTAQDGLRTRTVERAGPGHSRARDDDVTASPYANTRPGIRYVGDGACARCHAEICESYRTHPMGRSMSRVAPAAVPASASPPDHGSFRAGGFEYTIERKGDRLVHKEIRRDAWGRVLTEADADIRYVVGSGSRTFSFIIDRDGYLFESPISWYAQSRRWDLSPGYQAGNAHFGRLVTPVCLFCHANRVHEIAGTQNHYRQPIFEGYAIGCERCHGPGELHVKQPLARDGVAANIVNPSDLEPALREAVCQQCHLQGESRIERAGRSLRDYRPGLPLHRFLSVFTKGSKQGRKHFFGQVEQMYESRCFRASQGRMGCLSCHDPHQQPSATEKVAYYRDRCLNCHAEKGCRLAEAERLEQSSTDSCIACHMPRSTSPEIPHTATTIHDIPRFAGRDDSASDRPEDSVDPEAPLIHFHADLTPPAERPEVDRDRGIALVLRAHKLSPLTPEEAGRKALPLLESALAARPDDVPAWRARGEALELLNRREEALSAYTAGLKLAPDDESVLVGAGPLLVGLERRDEALSLWRRILAINPARAEHYHYLALVRVQFQDWGAAADACRASLRLNPADLKVRLLLVESYLKLGRKSEARDELMIVLGYDPPDRAAIERWYASQQ